MKITMNRVLTAFLLLGGLSILYSCGNGMGDRDSKEVTEDSNKTANNREEAMLDKLNEKDSQRVVNAYTANLYEIKLADTAKAYAMSSEAKSLASTLRDAHLQLNSQLKDLATKKQITLPSDITPEQQEKIKDLTKEKPKNFDKEYAELMVNKHKDAISVYEDCATECTDQDIRSWFASAVPELRKHLDMAKNSEQKLKELKK